MPDALLISTLASSSAGTSRFALDLLAILTAAGIVAVLARKLNVASIPLYLIAGALIGPSVLGLAGQEGSASITSMATVLLMFTVGLHLDVGALRSGIVATAAVTIVSTVAVAALCWPVGIAFGLSAPAALAIALALSLSSTAVILRTLEQRRELHTIAGRLTMGVTILHDMVALLILASLPLIAAWAKSAAPNAAPVAGDMQSLLAKASSALIAVGGISAMIVIARWGLPKAMRVASHSSEALLITAAAVALAAAVLTSVLGFSPELGAFLAGFILASTPFRYQIAGQLVPLRDLFMAVFFTAIGLGLPMAELASHWWSIPLAAALLIAIKAVVTAFTAWAIGASPATSVAAGLNLSQASEFSFVILAVAVSAGAITASENGSASAVVVLTLVAAPWMIACSGRIASKARRWRLAPWIARSALRDHPPAVGANEEGEPKILTAEEQAAEAAVAGVARGQLAIVAGFGPVGRAVVDNLERRGVVVAVIELNPKTIERQHRLGRAMIYGDASNTEVLERAGLSRAAAVVLTMPDEEAVIRACTVVRQHRPDVFIAARLNVLSRGLQAMTFGADHVVVEEMATAEAMAAQVLLKLEQRAAGEDTGPKLYELSPR